MAFGKSYSNQSKVFSQFVPIEGTKFIEAKNGRMSTAPTTPVRRETVTLLEKRCKRPPLY